MCVVLLTARLLWTWRCASGSPSGGMSAVASTQKASAAVARAKQAFPKGPLTILWGSQTGTAEGFAGELMRDARRRGFNAMSLDIEEYDYEGDLCDATSPIIFLLATNGEGEPTDNAIPFYRWANASERGSAELGDLRYAAFALGNTQYEHYCFMGKWAHTRLGELGAAAICPCGEGDDDEDIRADFERWAMEDLWPVLGGDDGEAAEFVPSFDCSWATPGAGAAPAVAAATAGAVSPSLEWLRRAFPKLQLLECRTHASRELTAGAAMAGSVKHVELGVQPVTKGRVPLKYEGADDLGVCCDNGRELAAATAARLGLLPSARFELKPTPRAAGVRPPLPTPATVEQALRLYADLRAPAPKPLLLLLAAHASKAAEAKRLRALCAPANKQDYADFVTRDGRGLAELLREFGSSNPPWPALLELAPKLTPRYYTISSSPLVDPKTVHLTVKVLREPMRGAAPREKVGVCSSQLGALAPGDTSIVFVRPSAFRLPRNRSVPVVMIGPGTGIAPFRAFVQQLVHETKATGAPRAGLSTLYFGCRHAKLDYLYEDELAAALACGALGQLRTAFSRDGAHKVYVQDRLREDGGQLAEAIHAKKGVVYICGGTTMGREVVALLQSLLVSYTGMTNAAAARYVKQMSTQGRLVQELWS